MGKVSAKSAVVLVGGYDLSTYSATYAIDYEGNPLPVTGFGDGWQNSIPGINSGLMSLTGFWDSDAGKSVTALKGLTNKCVSIIPDGFVLGNPSFSMLSEQEAFRPGGAVTDALQFGTVNFRASGVDGGPLPGWALHHAIITDTTTDTGFVDPSGGAVTARCAGFIHIWDATATATYVVKIQHDPALAGAYADLVTFTLNGTAIGSQHVAVASGVINQYRRVLLTRTGAADTFGCTVLFWHF